MNLIQLSKAAEKAALKAGDLVNFYFGKEINVNNKITGTSRASQVVTEVDKKCEDIILDILAPSIDAHNLAILTEEREDDESRFNKDYFWCIDPLDGTLPFIQKKSGYAVSIALVSKTGGSVIGIVYDPYTKNLYSAVKGNGLNINGRPYRPKERNTYLSYFTDHKIENTHRPDEIYKLIREYAAQLGLNEVKVISGGGSVMNAIYVLENGPACMIKLPKNQEGGGCIWDFAATACIFQEVGMISKNSKGELLNFNKYNTVYMNREGVFYSNF